MRKRKAIVLAGVLLATLGGATRAALVYDNGPPNATDGQEMTGWIEADDFSLGLPMVLTDVRFWAFDARNYAGSVVWSIYADSSGQPGALLERGTAPATGAFDHATSWGDSYRFDFAVGSISLAAGTYWLGLHNGPLTNTSFAGFWWEVTNANSTFSTHHDVAAFDEGGWSDSFGYQQAFLLFGAPTGPMVPAPGAILLGTLGTGLVGFVRRRRAL